MVDILKEIITQDLVRDDWDTPLVIELQRTITGGDKCDDLRYDIIGELHLDEPLPYLKKYLSKSAKACV